MATMSEIAKLAGVSRGTVDRVINNRGGVGLETAEKILRVAAQLNYSPNRAARSLSTGKRNFLLTFIVFHPERAPYYRDVQAGALQFAQVKREHGVEVKLRYIENWGEQGILTQLDEAVKDGSDGIALYGTSDAAVVERVRKITQSGIPVVTVGSEIPECGQLGFVGSNAFAAGRTAAGLISLFQREEIRLGIILGYRSRFYHNGRLAGLTAGLGEQSIPWSIGFTECNSDDEFDCFDIVKEQMWRHPEVNTLFLSTGNVYGACRALERMNLPRQPRVICYDNTSDIRQMIRKGLISASIGTEPVRQGLEALQILYDYLAFGTPPKEKKHYMENDIFIAENVEVPE